MTDQLIDSLAQQRSLAAPAAGACVTFAGWVRDHQDGRAVRGLDYQVYVTLAVKEGNRVLEEAKGRFPVQATACLHRYGTLSVGDVAVWVGVTAAHRDEAFSCCRFIIDEIKHRLPIWKKEHYVEGESHWVNCQHASTAGICRSGPTD